MHDHLSRMNGFAGMHNHFHISKRTGVKKTKADKTDTGAGVIMRPDHPPIEQKRQPTMKPAKRKQTRTNSRGRAKKGKIHKARNKNKKTKTNTVKGKNKKKPRPRAVRRKDRF